MRYPLRLARAAILLGALPTALAAQQTAGSMAFPASPATGAATPPCTYAACALRVEPSFGGPRLVRGTTGSTAARLGTLHPRELAELFAASDSALAYSGRYVRAERANRLLTLSGAVLGSVGLAQERRTNALTVTGAVLFVAGIPFQSAAQRSLSRAVWWYNASLAGAPSDRD